jgi:hypothetical protein
MQRNPDTTTALYDTDFFVWTQEQAAALRDGTLDAMDLANLAEEIESLGKRDRRAFESHVAGLVMHLLKWRYQPDGRREGHSWYSTIVEHRQRLARLQRDHPSLDAQRAVMLQAEYPGARDQASGETGLPLATFPAQCPWGVDQILAADFWPEG